MGPNQPMLTAAPDMVNRLLLAGSLFRGGHLHDNVANKLRRRTVTKHADSRQPAEAGHLRG